MHSREIVNRFILWILFLLSLIIFVIDLSYFREENELFYLLCNTSLVFRLLGCWFLPWILHVFCLLYLIYYYATLKWNFTNRHNALICLIPAIIQFILSLHLVLFRPGRSKSQRACRVGAHALGGVILIVIYYWMICFLINGSNFQCLLEMLYMFIFLFMILTPQFMTRGQAVVQAALEKSRYGSGRGMAINWDRKVSKKPVSHERATSSGRAYRGSTRGSTRTSSR